MNKEPPRIELIRQIVTHFFTPVFCNIRDFISKPSTDKEPMEALLVLQGITVSFLKGIIVNFVPPNRHHEFLARCTLAALSEECHEMHDFDPDTKKFTIVKKDGQSVS